MAIKKNYLKTKSACKVTFTVPKSYAEGASHVTLVGDFNDWDSTRTEMKPLKKGGFQSVLNLESGRSYQFRYVADGQHWFNDHEADLYVPSGFPDVENSVVVL